MSLESEIHIQILKIEQLVENEYASKIASIEKNLSSVSTNKPKSSLLISELFYANILNGPYDDYAELDTKIKELGLSSSKQMYQGLAILISEFGADKFNVRVYEPGWLSPKIFTREEWEQRPKVNYQQRLIDLLISRRVGKFIQDLLEGLKTEAEFEILPILKTYKFDSDLKKILESNGLSIREQTWVTHFLKDVKRLDTSEIYSIPNAIDDLFGRAYNKSEAQRHFKELNDIFKSIPNMSPQQWPPTYKSLFNIRKVFQAIEIEDVVKEIDSLISKGL